MLLYHTLLLPKTGSHRADAVQQCIYARRSWLSLAQQTVFLPVAQGYGYQ